MTIAPIAESTGLIGYSHDSLYFLPIGLTMAGLLVFQSHFFQKRNQETEILEQKALEDCPILRELTESHAKPANLGPLWAIIGLQGNLSFLHSDTGACFFISGGNFIRSSSHYVMRADYLPPRKSAFKRGLEKLSEIVENYKLPKFQPVPSPVPAG